MFKTLLSLFKSEPNVMFTRLNNIFKNLNNRETDNDLIILNKVVNKKCLGIISVEFKSNLGTVRINLHKSSKKYVELSYANYAGSFVFTLEAYDNFLSVKPLLGEDIKARDIDLAIYELEQYLQNTQEELIDNKDIEKYYNHVIEVEKLTSGIV